MASFYYCDWCASKTVIVHILKCTEDHVCGKCADGKDVWEKIPARSVFRHAV